MKTKSILFYSAFVATMLMTACGGGGEKEGTDAEDTTDTEDPNVKHKIEQTQKIVYSVPSPSEMANLLENAGAAYNYKLLNDVKNVDKYTSQRSRGLNLGIYGADLNYANIFENTQETMFYIQCTQKLAEAMGIENATSENTVSRAQDNVDNKDSMLNIVSEMFWELHDYLEQNDKMDITAFVIAGGWVEGLYLATQTVTDAKPNKEIIQKVADLKLSLEHLLALLSSYEPNENIDAVIADMKRFDAVYSKLETTKESTSTEQADGQTVINGGVKIIITMEQFKEIKALVAEIRENYASSN